MDSNGNVDVNRIFTKLPLFTGKTIQSNSKLFVLLIEIQLPGSNAQQSFLKDS